MSSIGGVSSPVMSHERPPGCVGNRLLRQKVKAQDSNKGNEQ